MDDANALPEQTIHLIARYQAGDRAAGDALYSRYRPRVRRIVVVRARAFGFQLADVDEIVQDTFLSATKSIQQFELLGEGGFINWLATIAANRMRDMKGREKALKRDQGREVPIAKLVAERTPSSLVWEPAADTTQVPDKVAREEEIEFTDACLARIREDYREAILLRNVAGCSWSTVAEKLGCPSVDAARKLYTRGRAALAAEMKRRRQGM